MAEWMNKLIIDLKAQGDMGTVGIVFQLIILICDFGIAVSCLCAVFQKKNSEKQ